MASGKTSVGRALAERTGWTFVDADDVIVARAGKPIHRIFEEDGEPAFRELERRVIADLCAKERQIIASGGGAFVSPQNRDVDAVRRPGHLPTGHPRRNPATRAARRTPAAPSAPSSP